MLMLAFLALLQATPKVDYGWENLTLQRDGELLARLPQGHGEYIHIRMFDPTALYYKTRDADQDLRQVASFSQEAHAKGYRVAGVLNCFQWVGFERTPDAEKLIDFQNVNAVNRKTALNFVSPLSSSVRQTILSNVSSMSMAQLPIDTVIVRFQFPRDPVLAFGQDARKLYIQECSLDPIDINNPMDETDPEASRFFEWRLKSCRVFLEEVLTGLRAQLPRTPIYLRGDPSWAFRSINVRGAQLCDWPYALSHQLIDGIVFKAPISQISGGDGLEEFAQTLASLNKPTDIWLEGTPEDQIHLTDFAKRLTGLGNTARVSLRVDTDK